MSWILGRYSQGKFSFRRVLVTSHTYHLSISAEVRPLHPCPEGGIGPCLGVSHFPVDEAADCAWCRPRTLAADRFVCALWPLAAGCHTIEIIHSAAPQAPLQPPPQHSQECCQAAPESDLSQSSRAARALQVSSWCCQHQCYGWHAALPPVRCHSCPACHLSIPAALLARPGASEQPPNT